MAREMTQEQIDAVAKARNGVQEALKEWVRVSGDPGDAEFLVQSLIFYETKGIDAIDDRIFARITYMCPNDEIVSKTQVRGLLDIVYDKVLHDLDCEGESE